MLLPSDPRIPSALATETAALGLLHQLHQEVLRSHDPNMLATALGKYAAVAVSRMTRGRRSQNVFPSLRMASAMERENQILQSTSNILRSAHDTSTNIINNWK